MKFQNPEILYFLWLLIIPILVHLFQLQKFVKVPFTNVAFLQKIVQDTRKSSQIKKWLILATRLLLFSAILFAFSQPYFSDKNITQNQNTFIYLDNSLSLNSRGENGNLLNFATQQIISNANENDNYSLFTNDNYYKNISYSDLKNELINVNFSPKKLKTEDVLLKIESENNKSINTLNKNILISDYQYNYDYKFTNVTPQLSLINLNPEIKNNISIDSVFIYNGNTENLIIKTIIRNQGDDKSNIPIALYNDENLISRQSFSIKENEEKEIEFNIQNQDKISGKIKVTFSDTFSFDNTFYFTKQKASKIQVLSIGEDSNYLQKIYNKNEFTYTNSSFENINYNSLQKQQLIILNELKSIPVILQKSLIDFTKNNGTIVIIPNSEIELNSYNALLKNLSINKKIKSKVEDILKITKINFNQPFLKDVFVKEISNFQYPNIKSHFPINSSQSENILEYENGKGFITELKTDNSPVYFINSSLNDKNSNFTKSPLIVPIFYNFGKYSFKNAKLYYYLNQENNIDIETAVKKDEILTLKNKNETFIPIQRAYKDKVQLNLNDKPSSAGFYMVLQNETSIQTLAFNNPKAESSLNYLDLSELETQENINVSNSIASVFKELNEKNEVHWLWKWFLILAIVSLLLEILILKFYKP